MMNLFHRKRKGLKTGAAAGKAGDRQRAERTLVDRVVGRSSKDCTTCSKSLLSQSATSDATKPDKTWRRPTVRHDTTWGGTK